MTMEIPHEPQPHVSPPNPRPFATFDDWARALRPAGLGGPPEAVADDASPYRPRLRLPMAIVRIVDDGTEEGELVRMRGDSLVIGRCDGDIVIPHDVSMAATHARIDRLASEGWRLTDLGSDRGTFVRVTSAKLKHGTVLQVGATLLQFQLLDLTEAWLVELDHAGHGHRHECHAPSATIGRAGGGSGIGLDDPFVSRCHARIYRTPRGWKIENLGVNGLWVRLETPVIMTAPSQFQCGEQRFVFIPLTEPRPLG